MLSFVIPTLNEEEHIDNLLAQLKPQLGEEDEVIIVDSFSKDKTVEIAAGHGAKIITQPKKGIGLAKTEGARNAKNDILVFMDADCVACHDFAERIRRHFSDERIIAVGGLDLYTSDSIVWRTLYNLYSIGVFHSSRIAHALTGKFWIPANNSAYRRDAFFKVGGFRSVVCEDTDMMHRMPASKDVVYDGDLVLTLSDRRFRQDGFFRTIALWGWSNVKCVLGDGKSTEGYRKD